MNPARRSVLAGLLVMGMVSSSAREVGGVPARIVALDWGLAATLIALGAPSVGIGEPALYQTWVGEPALPDGVRNVGLRLEPNLELLAELRPDLILINPLAEGARPLLERIAPVLSYVLYTGDGRPLDHMRAMTADLGSRLGRAAEAQALIAQTEERFRAARIALAGRAQRRLLAVGLVDARHVNVYGQGSLFGAVMAQLGLVNVWTRPTSDWGVSVAAVEDLAAYPEADLVVVEPVPAEAERSLARRGLWTSLMQARSGKVVRLPPAWAFGDLTAAMRFAGLLAARLGAAA